MTSSRSQIVWRTLFFAAFGHLLRPTQQIIGHRIRVIQDFAAAQEFAYHHFVSNGEEALTWTDLREEEAGVMLPACYNNVSLARVRDRREAAVKAAG